MSYKEIRPIIYLAGFLLTCSSFVVETVNVNHQI